MAVYAYVRVSSKDQNLDRQLAALAPYEVSGKNIFCDRQSGKDFERPGYQKLMKRLRSGDLLIVKSIDRLGRNYNDILVQWQYITKELKADILVLDMELLAIRKKSDNLTGHSLPIWCCRSSPMWRRQSGSLFVSGRHCGSRSKRNAVWEKALTAS